MLYLRHIAYVNESAAPVHFWIDQGLDLTVRQLSIFEIRGWVFSTDAMQKLTTLIVSGPDGVQFVCDFPLARADVAQAFPKFPGAARSGFYLSILLHWVEERTFPLVISAIHEDGFEFPLMTLLVEHTPPAPPHLLPADERWVIYTVVTQGHDLLLPPQVVEPNTCYIALVDDPKTLAPSPWEVRVFHTEARNGRVLARYAKLMPHHFFPEADASIYLDAIMVLTGDTRRLRAVALADADFAAFPHYRTGTVTGGDSIAYEAGEVKRLALDDPARVDQQMAFYQQEGFPDNLGLMEGGVLMRRHFQPQVVAAMETWWQMVQDYSHREQLSMMYALWKHNVRWAMLPGTTLDNSFAALTRRLRRRTMTDVFAQNTITPDA